MAGKLLLPELVEIDFTLVEFELACQTAGLFNGGRKFGDHRLWTPRVLPVAELTRASWHKMPTPWPISSVSTETMVEGSRESA